MKKFASQICFRVKDIEKSLDFYCEKLGFRFMFTFDRENKPFMYYLETGERQYLELIPMETELGKDDHFHHLTYLVDDVKKYAGELLEKGVYLYNGPASLGHAVSAPEELKAGGDGNMAFYVADPDGNNVEFMQFSDDCLQLKK